MNFISGISSLLAVSLLSPVQSILFLIILFISTSICLYTQGFILMGILYVLIYVGAIAILFLFILSLLNIEHQGAEKVSPLIVTLLSVALLPLEINEDTESIIINIENIYNELSVVGSIIYTDYAVLLLITAIILVLSVIGAISLTL